MSAYKDSSNPLIRGRFRAYDPEGNFKEIVTLSNDAKKRYEAKGWTFKRTNGRDNTRIW